MKGPRAFSLVEVTAVVATLGILAAILIVKIGTARNNTQNVVFTRLVKDAPTLRQMLILGNPPTYTPYSGAQSLNTFQLTPFTNLVIELISSDTIEIRNLPSTITKNGLSAFQFDGTNYKTNGTTVGSQNAFLSAFQL